MMVYIKLNPPLAFDISCFHRFLKHRHSEVKWRGLRIRDRF